MFVGGDDRRVVPCPVCNTLDMGHGTTLFDDAGGRDTALNGT